jgi:hypothetical protein
VRLVLLHEDPAVGADLREFERDWFTTVVPRGFVDGRSAIVLVDFGEGFEFLGRLEKTRAAATRKDGLRCSDLVEVTEPLKFDELEAEVPANVRAHMSYRTLPERTGQETLEALVRLRPALAETIKSLRPDRRVRERTDESYGTVAMEKDAVGVAMDIMGVDRNALTQWDTSADDAAPFMVGLREATLREDAMIVHDAGVFGDWEVVKRSAIGSVEFKSGDRSLTVINVNRTAIEKTLGVDLVYYNEHFHAFVLVQYKRMHKGAKAGWVYRPDANHDGEIKRMAKLPSGAADPLDALNYRLAPAACFFKLCESVVFDPYASELLKGMYLPLDYMTACATSAKGDRGGAAYGYSTVPRHLNNTLFVQLVQDGWIGSAGTLSDDLRAFVEARVEDGRSVILAIGTGAPRRGARR